MRRPLLASADANRRGATRVRTIAVIQARMTSTRLPGKVLMTVLGRPMLGYQVERVARARRLDGMVIATTSNASDDPVAAFAGKAGVPVFRGSEADVLGRVAGAAAALDATHVVRLTGDCPLSDPEIIDAVAARLIEGSPPVDFVTNGIPRSWPVGVDAEAMTMAALRAADADAVDAYDREHVTPYLYRNPDRFRLANLPAASDLSAHRWTLDEPADFELLRRILETLYPRNPAFGWRDVLTLVEAHPEWRSVNRAVAKKTRLYEAEAMRGFQSTTKYEVSGE